MKKLKEDLSTIWSNRIYRIVLIATAVFSYLYLITHATVGIDDTPYSYYFEEGLSAIVGRWVFFLVNKVVHVADFAPVVTDLAGVLLLMAAVTVWSALFYSVWKDRIPMWGYTVFAAIFLSCPLISEVFTYHLHNGVATGYLCSGISLYLLSGCLRELEKGTWKTAKKQVISGLAGSVTLLCIAVGCYESFLIVWVLGVVLLVLSLRLAGEKCRVVRSLLLGALLTLIGVVARSVVIMLITKCFRLEYLQDDAPQRSVTEMLAWLTDKEARGNLTMALKRWITAYGIFGYAYLPIAVYVWSVVVIGAYSIWKAIRNKDFWTLFLLGSSLLVPLLLVFVEGKVTLYRAAQFLPVVCAFGMLLAVLAVYNGLQWLQKRFAAEWVTKLCSKLNILAVCGALILVFNQCIDMNKWFYVDDMKYRDAVNTIHQVAHELEKGYDLSKPVVFAGVYEVPSTIVDDAYVDFGSETFFKMKRLTDIIDEHLLEKYYRNDGVWVAQTPALSVIDWSRRAFETNQELVKFFAMHGHTIQPLMDKSLYDAIETQGLTMPVFPQEGSILDAGEYIIVHF